MELSSLGIKYNELNWIYDKTYMHVAEDSRYFDAYEYFYPDHLCIFLPFIIHFKHNTDQLCFIPEINVTYLLKRQDALYCIEIVGDDIVNIEEKYNSLLHSLLTNFIDKVILDGAKNVPFDLLRRMLFIHTCKFIHLCDTVFAFDIKDTKWYINKITEWFKPKYINSELERYVSQLNIAYSIGWDSEIHFIYPPEIRQIIVTLQIIFSRKDSILPAAILPYLYKFIATTN